MTNCENKNVFEELRKVSFGDEKVGRSKTKPVKYTDKEGILHEEHLKYISWATALDELLQRYPDATYRNIEFDINGNEIIPGAHVKLTKTLQDGTTMETETISRGYPYRMMANGFMVETEVSVNGMAKRCQLPVMGSTNRATNMIDTTVVNKSLMRCLVKNIALFGLGLYVYSGEDFPSDDDTSGEEKTLKEVAKKNTERKFEKPEKQKPEEKQEAEDPETDPLKRKIRTPYKGYGKVVGKPMSTVITEAKSIDSSMELLNWYSENGKEGDSELAQTLLVMLKAGKISFPASLQQQSLIA